MRIVKYIGVVVGAVGFMAAMLCAGEPDPHVEITTWQSLIWVYAGVAAVILGVVSGWVYELVIWWRRETRLRRRQERRRAS